MKKNLSAKLIEVDSEGRYVFLELLFQGKKILIVGLYAPNQQQKQFYKLLHGKISQLDYRSVILMGDWNGVLDSMIDKKRTSKTFIQTKLPKPFFDMKEELELTDIWRERNKTDRDFPFYSDRHQSFSRIDFFLITNDFLSRVKKVKIFPRTLSDHSPVWMELYVEDGNRRSWRLNENLFTREEVQSAHFPKLSEEQQKVMNCSITSEEIGFAIRQLKVGKSPGTDGLTSMYYKTLSEEMMEPLKELFNSILKGTQVI